MLRSHRLPIVAARCLRGCLVALYAATALLGSGGLHAIAPTCNSATCDSTGCVAGAHAHSHSHAGCTHSHSHATAPDAPRSETPADHDHEHCFVCQYAATAVVPAAMVVPPEVPEAATDVNAHVEPRSTIQPAFRFLIRGPPATV